MSAAFEQKVRERAYAMWQASGMDEGSADAHWLSAEHAVKAEADQIPAKKKKKPVASVKPSVVKSAPRKSVKMSAGASA